MDEIKIEDVRNTVKYFPELYLYLLDELNNNDISRLKTVTEDRVAKYLGLKLLTEFVVLISKNKKYTNIVRIFRDSKVDEVRHSKPYYSLL